MGQQRAVRMDMLVWGREPAVISNNDNRLNLASPTSSRSFFDARLGCPIPQLCVHYLGHSMPMKLLIGWRHCLC